MNKQLWKLYLANITHLATSSLIKYKIYFILNEKFSGWHALGIGERGWQSKLKPVLNTEVKKSDYLFLASQ